MVFPETGFVDHSGTGLVQAFIRASRELRFTGRECHRVVDLAFATLAARVSSSSRCGHRPAIGITSDTEAFHLGLADLDALTIMAGIERALDLETFGRRRPDGASQRDQNIGPPHSIAVFNLPDPQSSAALSVTFHPPACFRTRPRCRRRRNRAGSGWPRPMRNSASIVRSPFRSPRLTDPLNNMSQSAQ
jgi:hypothetical protein